MAEVIISKHKFRKGTNDQRKTIIFDQGEPAYTTDTRRLYIGTGTLSGGNVIGSKVHPILSNYYSLSTTIAEINDIVIANNKFYQLTAVDYSDIVSWADISLSIDPTLFNYTSTNQLTLNLSSISTTHLNPSTIGNGLKIDSGILQINLNTNSLELSNNKLSIKSGGITERDINSSSLSSGLIGGSGTKIQLDIDPAYFVFSGNKLSLSASPTSITFSDLEETWFGDGLDYNLGLQQIKTVITDVDGLTLTKDVSGIASINPTMFDSGLYFNTGTNTLSTNLVDTDELSLTKNSLGIISLSNLGNNTSEQWAGISVDDYGRVVNATSAIYDILSGNSALGWENGTNTLSSLFNGSPNGIYSGGELTKFTVLSTNGTNNAILTLSSAGFIVFEGGSTTRTGQPINRFAIPIFTF